MTDDSKENEDNRERYQYPQLTITLSLHCWVIRGDWKEKLYQHCYQAIQKKKKPSECRTVFLQKEQRAVLTALWGGGPCKRALCGYYPSNPLSPGEAWLLAGSRCHQGILPGRPVSLWSEEARGQPSCQLDRPPSSVNVWASDQLALLLSRHRTEMPHTFCFNP